MGEIDTAQQWRQLQELYRSLSAEELERVAGEAYQLTDIAKQALHAEIAHRNLKVIVRLQPPAAREEPQPKGDYKFDPAELPLRSVMAVENRDEAGWVQATLNHAGIVCLFYPGYLEDVEQLEFSRFPEFTAVVLDMDVERARHALRSFDEHFDKEEEEELHELVLHCPKCRSTEVVFQGLDSGDPEGPEDIEDGKDVRAANNRKPPEKLHQEPKYRWACDVCGYRWEDDGMEG